MTYSNLHILERFGFEKVVIPLQRRIVEAFTTQFLALEYPSAVRGRVKFAFDNSHVSALRASEAEKQEQNRANYQAGIISRSEARVYIGLADEPDEDEPFFAGGGGMPLLGLPVARCQPAGRGTGAGAQAPHRRPCARPRRALAERPDLGC